MPREKKYVSELEDIAKENILKSKKTNIWKNLRDFGTISSDKICKKGGGEMLEKNGKNFPNLIKIINSQISEAQYTPRKTDMKKISSIQIY